MYCMHVHIDYTCMFCLPVWDVDWSAAVSREGPQRNYEPDSEVSILWMEEQSNTEASCHILLLFKIPSPDIWWNNLSRLCAVCLSLQGASGNASVPERRGPVSAQGFVQEEPCQQTGLVSTHEHDFHKWRHIYSISVRRVKPSSVFHHAYASVNEIHTANCHCSQDLVLMAQRRSNGTVSSPP